MVGISFLVVSTYFVLSIGGRIRTYRLAGSKLIFFDIVQDGHKVQVMCNQRLLSGVTPEKFKQLYRLLRRGDAFCMYYQSRNLSQGFEARLRHCQL